MLPFIYLTYIPNLIKRELAKISDELPKDQEITFEVYKMSVF